MIIILFGPPGAGKGTQAENLVKDFHLHKVSTGDLLRNEIKNNTNLGKKIKDTIDKGMYVSDDIVIDLVKKVLSNKKLNKKLIFDGYPRTINQAKDLDALMKKNDIKISCVLSLNVNQESVIKRILGRQVCSNCGMIFNEFFNQVNKESHKCDNKFLIKRSDDNRKTIANRYQTYLQKTLPILNYYKDQKLLHEIDGGAKINDIYNEIRRIISTIEP